MSDPGPGRAAVARRNGGYGFPEVLDQLRRLLADQRDVVIALGADEEQVIDLGRHDRGLERDGREQQWQYSHGMIGGLGSIRTTHRPLLKSLT